MARASGLLVDRLHAVGQTPGPAHDRDRAVAHAEHLVQPAWLVAREHQDHVAAGFDHVEYEHVRREHNTQADRLANEGVDAWLAR